MPVLWIFYTPALILDALQEVAAMDLNKFTIKSQQALQEAQTKVITFGHQEVDGEHLLLAMAEQSDGLFPLRRYIQSELETQIGRALIAGDVPEGNVIRVDLKNYEISSHTAR
jgi:ATP-dependent Clp protease ATP-binding subunit ClpA